MENFKPVPQDPVKWQPFKFFCEITQKFSFKANIAKGTVLGLTQFLASESPRKLMKNGFYFRSQDISVFVLTF